MSFRLEVCKTITVDVFGSGCTSETKDLSCIETKEFPTTSDLLDYIRSFGEPRIFDNGLLVSLHENDEGERPSLTQLELFKVGRINLWLADYSFYIAKIERTDWDHTQLIHNFPTLEIEE